MHNTNNDSTAVELRELFINGVMTVQQSNSRG